MSSRIAFDDFTREAGIAVEPVNLVQIQIARGAYRADGKGTTHPARLSFGDCFAYALAKLTFDPLLLIGSDFAQADVVLAIPGEHPRKPVQIRVLLLSSWCVMRTIWSYWRDIMGES